MCLNWIKSKVINILKWNKYLFSLYLEKNINNFISGQFTRLAIKINNNYVYRYYSFINSPNEKLLEFYIYRLKDGYLSNILYNINIGDYIYVDNNNYGNFIIYNLFKNKKINYLWMICTNTGISPFLSILEDNLLFFKNNIKKIIFIYGVKKIFDVVYINKILYFLNKYNNYLDVNIFFSREKKIYFPYIFYKGKVSNINLYYFIKNKNNINIDISNYFMICGNRNMVKDVVLILKKEFKIINNNIITEIY